MKSEKPIAEIEPLSGTYLLILNSQNESKINIGKLGSMALRRGYYFYVGSAFGPGGIRARVSRHLRHEKSCRWHIDYLRVHCSLENVLINYSTTKHESLWVERLLNSPEYSIPFNGFGASDSAHPSHLLYTRQRSSNKKIASTLTTADIVAI